MADVERRRAGVDAAGGRLELHQGGVGMPVTGREPAEFVLGHPQAGVEETEGSEQVVGQVIVQMPTGRPGDQDSEDAEGVVVTPPLSRLEGQRKFRQAREPLVGPESTGLGADVDSAVGHRLLQRALRQYHPVARGVGQQVPQCDLPNGR
jgi:hypothetical protein